MKKILSNIMENKKIHYLIIIIVSLLCSIPLIKFQVNLADDGIAHLLRIMGMTEIFKSGEFPQYINPYYCNNWGYSINIFYSPLVTYIPYLFKLFTVHYYDALKIFTMLTIIISGFTMYECTQEISKSKRVALIASIIYILYPYRLECIYTRFAIGEFSAYMFLPIIFMGLYNLLNGDGKKHYYIAIGASLLVLTHIITTEYMAVFCLIYILFNYKKLNKAILKKLFINVAIIIGITAFFIIPIAEYKVVGDITVFDAGLMKNTNMDVQKTTISFTQLFKNSEDCEISFIIGIPITFFIAITILIYKKIPTEIKDTYTLLFFFSILSIIMCLNIFPWFVLPNILCTLQYSWRMFTFFGFFISIICGINANILIEYFSNKKNNIEQVFFVSVLVILLVSIPIITRYNNLDNSRMDIDYEEKILNNPKISHMSINRDYLPIKATLHQHTYMKTRDDKVQVLNGFAMITEENKDRLNLSFNIENSEKDTVLEFPYLYYLGYEATITTEDNQTIKVKTFESDNGFVAIKLPNDISKATVDVKYKGTTIEKISYIISTITLILCIIYLITKYIKIKGEKIENKQRKVK